MMEMRFVKPSDADMLLSWRNDPSTLACFKSTAEVSREDHAHWMRYSACDGYPAHIVWIGENDGCPVGVVRFDQERGDVMRYRVSITVAPEQRGNGFGQAILESGCSAMWDSTLVAEIKHDNKASRLIFEKCGFKNCGLDQHGDIRYERGPM